MSYPAGVTVQRDRRRPKDSAYNPDRQTVPGWGDVTPEDLDTIELVGAYLGNSSTNAVPDAMRQASVEYTSLFTDDSSVDIQVGDRIRYGTRAFFVNSLPPTQVPNPWSAWDPGAEFPLTTKEG